VKLTCQRYALRVGKTRLLREQVEGNDDRDCGEARDVPANNICDKLHNSTNSMETAIECAAAKSRKRELFDLRVDTGG
jgi:hypothetical protein